MLESRVDIRVEWGHCDPARIVYNPNFYDWMEAGLLALFEAAGLHLVDMMRKTPGFRGTPLVRGEATFRAPARVGDTLVLVTRVARLGGSSFDVAHRFELAGRTIVDAVQTRVWGMSPPDDPDRLVAARIPDEVRAALSAERASHLRYIRD